MLRLHMKEYDDVLEGRFLGGGEFAQDVEAKAERSRVMHVLK
jgi:hypothetical protein